MSSGEEPTCGVGLVVYLLSGSDKVGLSALGPSGTWCSVLLCRSNPPRLLGLDCGASGPASPQEPWAAAQDVLKGASLKGVSYTTTDLIWHKAEYKEFSADTQSKAGL